ncbi:unnamed protein product [Malus baccata var. baccata]
MAGEKGASGLKLEGGAYGSTHGLAVNPVVIQSDASTVPSTVKLNGTIYPLWSKVLEMHVAGRGKKGFVTGSVKEPKKNNTEYEAWEVGNAIVKEWLINFMDPTIMGFVIHLHTAKEVWDKVKSFQLRQEGRPIGVYYADPKAVWQDLDQRRPFKIECVVDLKALHSEKKFNWIVDILRTQPLPSVDEVFSIVRREAQRHATMMGSSGVGNQ